MCFLITLVNILIVGHTSSLRLKDLQVPRLVLAGDYAQLSCHWQLDPGEELYSVKWYKDGNEFFRYIPKNVEPSNKFVLPGVNIEAFDKSGAKIVLSHAEPNSSGRYRCEVSGERPFFLTVSEHRDMVIVVPPKNGPIITGWRSKYRIGDKLIVYCTCGPSSPSSHLAWYINGEPTHNIEHIMHLTEGDMTTSKISLNFSVETKHFTKNILKVKCLATISPIYWKSNEECAVQERSTNSQLMLTQAKYNAKQNNMRGDSSKTNSDFKIILIYLVNYHILAR